MSKYNIGDQVWLISIGTKEISKPCPICAGQLNVILILGTGENVTLPCDYCGKGHDFSRGMVHEYEYSSGAEQDIIDEIRIEKTVNGETIKYLFSNHSLVKEDEVFATQEKALARCQILCERRRIEQQMKATYLKKDQLKSYSWNAGYHLREAKRCEADAARHREQAIICKSKGGEK